MRTVPDNDPDDALAEQLRERRPEPPRQFSERLRSELLARHAAARRPPHLWWLIAAYVASGIVLLVLAAIGATGGGPLGS